MFKVRTGWFSCSLCSKWTVHLRSVTTKLNSAECYCKIQTNKSFEDLKRLEGGRNDERHGKTAEFMDIDKESVRQILHKNLKVNKAS